MTKVTKRIKISKDEAKSLTSKNKKTYPVNDKQNQQKKKVPEEEQPQQDSASASDDESDESEERDEFSDMGTSDDEDLADSEGDNDNDNNESESESNDEEDIRKANELKHTKKKRKRAMPTPKFGQTLSTLLEAPPKAAKLAPTKPQKHPILERRAKKLATLSRHEQLERGHVKDVIGGWRPRPKLPFSEWADAENAVDEENGTLGGAEKEKELRRTAQRGVVKLFNAIKTSQGVVKEKPSTTSASSRRSTVSSVAPSTAAPQENTNLLSARGKEAALTNMSRDAFLDLIKKGSS